MTTTCPVRKVFSESEGRHTLVVNAIDYGSFRLYEGRHYLDGQLDNKVVTRRLLEPVVARLRWLAYA